MRADGRKVASILAPDIVSPAAQEGDTGKQHANPSRRQPRRFHLALQPRSMITISHPDISRVRLPPENYFIARHGRNYTKNAMIECELIITVSFIHFSETC